jgi:hypothetical protein
MNKKWSILAIVTLVALLSLMLGVGVATEIRAQGDDSGVIYACVHNKSGKVRIVDPDESCKKHWTAIRLAAITEVGNATVPGDLQVQGGILRIGNSIVIDGTAGEDTIIADPGDTISFVDDNLATTGKVRVGEFVGDPPEKLLVVQPAGIDEPAIEGVQEGNGSAVVGRCVANNCWSPAIHGINSGGGVGVTGSSDGPDPSVEGFNHGDGMGVRGISQYGVGVRAVSTDGDNVLEAWAGDIQADPPGVELLFAVERVGYIRFPTISGGPPPDSDCDSLDEAGRMVVRTDGTTNLYVCTSTDGWVGK